MAPDDLKDTIRQLPPNPGVYRFFDKEHKILYVGKAKNLKKRVSSYFSKQVYENRKTAVLVSKISAIECTVVENEYDALLLENSLIKSLQPRYNINLKDDKSYPFIKITNERFPRVFPIRNPIKDGSAYFGPYSSVKVMHVVLELIKKLYPIRSCSFVLSKQNIEKNKFRLCLEYDIGNCKGPCTGLQSLAEYDEQIKQIKFLLKGNLFEVKNTLKNQIQLAVDKLAFEDAHKLKQKLDLVEKYQSKSTVVNPAIKDVEVLTLTKELHKAFVNYMRIADGMVVQTRNIEVVNKLEEADEDILLNILAEIRNEGNPPAAELLMPFFPEWSHIETKINVPQIGDKKRLLELSLKNALYFKKDRMDMAEKTDPDIKLNRLLNQIKQDLSLVDLPVHMECFDNSNLQGHFPVSACVVFKNTKPAKADYRIFNVKSVTGPDDFASMYEVVFRRYKRLLDENESLPQLIIVDGGKGQLSASVKALKDLNCYGKIAIVGIAKRLEELYFPNDPMPLHLDKKSMTLKIIQQMRDEAHRFGIKHHRNKRSKAAIDSELNHIQGIGEKTAITLLTHFKSVKNIKNANLNELISIVGKAKAMIVYAYFNPEKLSDINMS